MRILRTREKNVIKALKAQPKLKIKRGDTVKVISGGDKGKTGKVLEVDAAAMRILVEGVNQRKRHVKPSQKFPQGGVISKEAPIHYSNVQVVDGKGKTTRIAMKVEQKGGKIVRLRVAKTTKETIAEPVRAGASAAK